MERQNTALMMLILEVSSVAIAEWGGGGAKRRACHSTRKTFLVHRHKYLAISVMYVSGSQKSFVVGVTAFQFARLR
jgi:hypothetical protein